MGLRLGVEKTRLVCQQWHGAVDGHTVQLQVQHRCTDCGLRTQIRSNCWIWGLTANGFFLFRGRDVAITMNSVKILHAVRSAITAIAELLVCLFIVFVFLANKLYKYFVASIVPEIIGGTPKMWAVPRYAQAPFSSKFVMGFSSDRPYECTRQNWRS